MHKKLILAAFEKSRIELELKGADDPSIHQMAIQISNYLTTDFGFSFGERSLTNYFNSAKAESGTVDVRISQLQVVEGLCDYLDYSNYQEFCAHLKSPVDTENDGILNESIHLKPTGNPRKWKQNFLIWGVLGVLLMLGIVATISINSPQWMVWKGDHYEEVEFDEEHLRIGALKVYKAERIERFKKLKNPDCTYDFFNEDGSVRVWYGKNNDGNLDYFTDIGLHPETGKTLKPMTPYD